MTTTSIPPGSVNNGIQATNVHAGAIAVGNNATATAYGAMNAETQSSLQDAIALLNQAIAKLDLNEQATAIVQQETQAMSELAASNEVKAESFAHALKRLKDKLLMAGVVVADVVALANPIRSIAETLRLPLDALGLSMK